MNDSIGVMPMIAFNHLHPPFDNPKLLRALLPAVDQPAFVEAAMGSEPELIHVPAGVFTPGLPMASDAGMEVFTDPRDLALARRLVAESGYNGEKVVLMSPSDYPAIQALCQVARDLFEQAGLNVDYASMDWATLVQRRASREPPDAGRLEQPSAPPIEGLSLATPGQPSPAARQRAGRLVRLAHQPAHRGAARGLVRRRRTSRRSATICEQIQLLVWEEVPYHPARPVVQPDGDARPIWSMW